METRKGPSVVMLAIISIVVSMTAIDLMLFMIVRSKHRGLVRLRREVLSGLEAVARKKSAATAQEAEKSERVQTKTKKIQGAQGGTNKGTPSDELKLEETLETTVGPTLSSLIYAQGWALSDQRVATLIKGIVDPRVGEVLEELLVEILE
uniref:Uncharacterized protein n=1 Tax=Rhodosorus marinus TaxID=101924 RepID=A0A7S3EC74_9RHOD|mmetsp:Transcript_22061/g.89474  ORF Transcript_22061/g.89474 Transcript_22061/m.89474 type:complete len:150 (+) Transcript_22061:168-617(+)|eukprot:CAMPEP_0113962476 /NCGR_PEP_ID=MMETSP0011_2-20120614/5938_1 /TAXON_ID=101924 /ORGANISM="Rhodosorus marinus" /LENGTH=149 /DNA_ID=CAMNT_0000974337 /DNA_START=144 /DNA_END=593 /DNA_ORIENTATION=- /assembly_acc=CAM_ASM_000156